jgi:ketosteroid isomerase-like protein
LVRPEQELSHTGTGNSAGRGQFASGNGTAVSSDSQTRRSEDPQMKNGLSCAALLLSLAGIGASSAMAQASDPVTPSDRRTEADIRRLNAEEVAAFIHNDPAAMARLWSDDFVVTNPLNKFVNKLQVLGMVQSGILVISSYDRQIEYLQVYGDVVVVAGNETVTWGGRMPNAGKSERLRFTGIWKKQHGRWQEVARHANIVPSP